MGEKMRTISAKVSDEIYELISDIAKHKNITISEAIKQSILNARIEDKQDKKIIAYELNRIGNKLNQIAKHCNIKKAVDIAVLQELKIIEDLLREVAKK